MLGQYHWVYCLTPESYRATASWFTGWISIGGQIVFTASAAFAAGLQFQALVTMNHLDTYVPTRWQGMLFYWLILAYSAAVNIFGSKVLPHTNTAAGKTRRIFIDPRVMTDRQIGILHMVGFIAVVGVLGAMSSKHSATYVFTEFSNTSGWGNDGVSWLVGLLSAVYPFLGYETFSAYESHPELLLTIYISYDAACHLSEELPKPSRNVPLAMVGSVVINGLMGLVYAIVLLFGLGDLQSLLASKIGFPFMQLFLNVTRSPAGASILAVIVSLIAMAANAAGTTSTSRTAWAFARDRGLPSSKFFSVVNPTLKVPVRMVLVVVFLQMLLGLIYLGSSTAFNAVLSMAILGMYASYFSPILFMFMYGRRTSTSIARGMGTGAFNLGPRWGPAVNVAAMMWLILAMVFSTFPTVMPVTPGNMNYCVVVTMAWVVLGAVYYYLFRGKGRFTGPVVELPEEM